MKIKSIGAAGATALAGGATGAALMAAAGAPVLAAGLGGLAVAGCAVAAVRVVTLNSGQAVLEKAFVNLQREVDILLERQAQSDARMAEVERLTVESPALVWRAATADIEVLGSLVSDLAKTVSGHEQRLAGVSPASAASSRTQPFPSAAPPEWYEDEAELGFTADVPASASLFDAPSPAVMAELKSTLASALASDRLELCLQPVVTLPQRKTRGYEATLRLKGGQGELQTDADLRRIAAATALEADLDRVLVDRAVHVLRILRARDREVSLYCQIAGSTLASAAFIETLERLIRADSGLGAALVLEISDADFRTLPDEARGTMTMFSGKGIRFGLDRLPHLKLDMREMESRGIRHVRVSARTLIQAGQDGESGADIHPADLAEYLQRRGIELLVADVASEQTILDLLDFAVPLAIGALFGASRPVRPEVLEPRAVDGPGTKSAPSRRSSSQAPAVADEPATPARGQRQSFRSLLRRA